MLIKPSEYSRGKVEGGKGRGLGVVVVVVVVGSVRREVKAYVVNFKNDTNIILMSFLLVNKWFIIT